MRLIATLSAAAIALTASTFPSHADRSRVEAIGRCMAFYAVLSGMDGTKEPDSVSAGAIKDLGTELYSEGDRAGLPHSETQDTVVAALVALNMQIQETGRTAVEEAMGEECGNMVDQVRGLR